MERAGLLNENEADYKPGTIAPKDLYYSDKHGKLVAMDDVDGKYHDRLELVYKKGDRIEDPMNENKLNERVATLEDFIELIKERAIESDVTEEEEAKEIIDAIADHYKIRL